MGLLFFRKSGGRVEGHDPLTLSPSTTVNPNIFSGKLNVSLPKHQMRRAMPIDSLFSVYFDTAQAGYWGPLALSAVFPQGKSYF